MIIIALLLGLRFYLMLFFPGTEATSSLFKLILPYWERFSNVCLVFKSPLLILFKFLPGSMVGSLKPWFPEMPAALLMANLNHKPLSFYKAIYPGTVEWVTLLAIPFWGLFLFGWLLCFKFLRANIDIGAVVEESKQMISEHQAHKAIEQKLEAKRSGQNMPADTDGYGANSRTQERLSKSKNQPAHMPQVIIKPDDEDWERYKQEQGDLMVTDMVRQLRRENANLHAQQSQLRTTLSQYFSPSVLQYLEAHKGKFQNMDNEKRVVSVLFCDIRGFSEYSLNASSDEVVRFLGEYFEIASQCILHKHHGVISKLMGDGLMAYWGFPVPTEEHAYIATQAALDILHEVDLRNQTRPDAVPLKIGIGIATGHAIVGNIGSEDFKDFTLIGPSVNMAARLEEANKTLGTRLLISGETHQALHGKIPCQDCGEIDIRGWHNREHVYSPKQAQ